MSEGASERGSAHMLHTRKKQTRRWAALSEHQHARVRLGMQCMHALMLCVWPDHACLSLGQEGCSVHKQGVMLRTPGSLWSSRRRPCTLVERLAAVRVVSLPDRQGHTQEHARIHTYTNVDTYRHTHKHLHTHMHAYTHT